MSRFCNWTFDISNIAPRLSRQTSILCVVRGIQVSLGTEAQKQTLKVWIFSWKPWSYFRLLIHKRGHWIVIDLFQGKAKGIVGWLIVSAAVRNWIINLIISDLKIQGHLTLGFSNLKKYGALVTSGSISTPVYRENVEKEEVKTYFTNLIWNENLYHYTTFNQSR